MKQLLLAVAAAAAVGGCAAGSKLELNPEIPHLAPGGNVRLETLSIERWWTLFGDPALERLVDESLARNADLESAAARVREAQASLGVARAAQSPTLDAKAGSARQHQSAATFSSHRFSLEAGYEADFWGKLSSATAAARHQLLATEWARAALEWSLTASVAEAYFELAAVDRQIEISEAVRASRLNTVSLRTKEYGAGAGSELDLRRAEADLAATDSTLASLGRQRAALEHALALLSGRTPQEIMRGFSAARLDEGRTAQAVLPQGAAAGLLVRRPDIRQAEAQLAAANASIDAARAATLPSLRLTGAIGTDSQSVSSLFSGPAAIWSLGASLAQPIVDGGRLKARVQEEQARGEQALAAYRKAVATAVADVREAYANLDLTEQAFHAERSRVASLARAHDLARRGFGAGALAYLDLLDAERNLYQAQLQQVGAVRDQLVGQVAAFKALGGGYGHPGSSL
jgi:multidrug efflux system outer membrane protein